MAIWSSEIKELEKLFLSLKGQLPDLEKELERLIKADDENMVLLYSRRCLEVIITDLCVCELNRPRKTEPLQGIIDKLHKEEKVPSHIIASMHGLNELSTYGAHPKDFDPKQVRTTLINLDTIIEWYLKHKECEAEVVARSTEGIRQEVKSTEDVKKRTQIPRKRLTSFIIGSILLIVIVVAVLFFSNIIGSGKQIKESEKSIAVLPFKSLSDDPNNQYLADGMMDAILLHLSKIKDLRVLPRTSVEQYRGTTKVAHDIGQELDVEYLLEGSFQKFGDNARLIVQLIRARKESHVWAGEYNSKWSEIFSIQSGVAQTIAKELYASITPEEKKLIEKVPTTDTAAYELYLKANNYLKVYEKNRDSSFYHNAVAFYNAALVIDPSFAKAYTGLASAYYRRYYYETYFKEGFLDSMLVLANKALSIDNQLDEAYYLKGTYYQENGQSQEAMDNFDKALKINPNYYSAYVAKGGTWSSTDFIKSIENYHEALNLIRGDERSSILRDLGQSYMCVGFMGKAKYYFQEAFALDGDSAEHFRRLALIESSNDNYKNAILFGEKANNTNIEWYSIEGQHQEAYMAAQKEIEQLKISGELPLVSSHRIGYSFLKVGKFNEADYYFKEQIKYGTESIKLGRGIVDLKSAQYDLAAVYAFLGDKPKAYQYLDDFNTMNVYPLWWVSLAKHDPLFESIRNEERFQMILQNVEAKYQTEHERVRKWLEEQGML